MSRATALGALGAPSASSASIGAGRLASSRISEVTRRLASGAAIVLAARMAALSDRWDAVREAAPPAILLPRDAAQGQQQTAASYRPQSQQPLPPLLLPAGAWAELALLAAEAEHRAACGGLAAAIPQGAAAGVAGAIDATTVTTVALDEAAAEGETARATVVALLTAAGAAAAAVASLAAYANADPSAPPPLTASPPQPPDASFAARAAAAAEAAADAAQLDHLLATAGIVTRLRAALLRDDWPAVATVVRAAAALPNGVADAAVPELELVVRELHHRAIVHGPLAAAVAADGVSGLPGCADLTRLGCGSLEAAIERAQAIGCISDGSARLVALAQVRSLREGGGREGGREDAASVL